jgi:Arc/MetJ-type ribon-helix-helix transcriptional regulator
MTTTKKTDDRIDGWFEGRLPAEWRSTPADISVDREEIVVLLTQPDVDLVDASEAAVAEARVGRAKAFREETRDRRMEIAREAEHRFEAKVSWGIVLGERRELWTHVAAPVMTRLRQPQRQVLDTLVEAGVARSRSDALAWCVRLVAQHEGDWLAELQDAMTGVADVRAKGPAA